METRTAGRSEGRERIEEVNGNEVRNYKPTRNKKKHKIGRKEGGKEGGGGREGRLTKLVPSATVCQCTPNNAYTINAHSVSNKCILDNISK